jgi:hypothetical protein
VENGAHNGVFKKHLVVITCAHIKFWSFLAGILRVTKASKKNPRIKAIGINISFLFIISGG